MFRPQILKSCRRWISNDIRNRAKVPIASIVSSSLLNNAYRSKLQLWTRSLPLWSTPFVVNTTIFAFHSQRDATYDASQPHHSFPCQSVTFAGFYCMPSEGVQLSPSENILTNNEVLRLSALFVRSGVTKIRLTGGEPTVRKGIVDLVGKFFLSLLRTSLTTKRL